MQKIKVMWICNLPNEEVSLLQGQRPNVAGGWLTGLSEKMKENTEVDLIYCFPQIGDDQVEYKTEKIHYYSFNSEVKWPFLMKIGIISTPNNKDSQRTRARLNYIIEKEKPDIFHIWGTEFIHSYIVSDMVKDKNKLLCSIQGLTSIYATHYLSLVPDSIKRKKNISSIFRGTLKKQEDELARRGRFEIATLKNCPNVIGRTSWDKTCTYFINPNRKYFFCNETLRKGFYEKIWELSKCRKHRLFVSQGSSPIKGLTIVVEALSLLVKEYPDIELVVAGNNFIKGDTIKSKMMRSVYGSYIYNFVVKNKLNNNIHFLGPLSEEEMIATYLETHIFISSSSIENSSNSVGEAMLLGVPVVSSFVGGIMDLLEANIEGLYYQTDAPYMLAGCIKRIFDDDNLAIELGKNAHKRACVTHNADNNDKQLLQIYNEIYVNQKRN